MIRIWISCFLMAKFSLFRFFQIQDILRMGRPWTGPLSKLLKFLKLEKKFLEIFVLRVLWTSKLFWWKVWILFCIRQANLIEKAYIPNSVAAFFSRFRNFKLIVLIPNFQNPFLRKILLTSVGTLLLRREGLVWHLG